tara:strand:- start:685604 stop:685816 length:213 start_codon:yes stop_codon:yes gene_type:complete
MRGGERCRLAVANQWSVSDVGEEECGDASRTQARYEPLAATGGDEAVAPPTSSKAPPVAGKARRREPSSR